MTATTPTPPPAPDNKQADKELTAADAAKRVKRKVVTRVPVMERGEQARDQNNNPVFEDEVKHVAIEANEVLAFKDYGSHVVVVTKDGQKFSSADKTSKSDK